MKLLYDGGGRDPDRPYTLYDNAVWQSGTRYYELVRSHGYPFVHIKIAEAVVNAENGQRWTSHILQTQRFPIDPDESWDDTKAHVPDYLFEMLL